MKKPILMFFILFSFCSFGQNRSEMDRKTQEKEQLPSNGKLETQSRSPFVETQQMSDDRAEQEKFLNGQRAKVNSLKQSNTVWNLASISIEESRLMENKTKKDELLRSAKEEYSKGLIYAESETEALLATTEPTMTALIFGDKKMIGSNTLLVNHLSGCATCSNEYSFERVLGNNELKLIIQDQDEDKKDVFYIFTFKN